MAPRGVLGCLALLLVACDRGAGNEELATRLTGGDPAGGRAAIERYGCGGCHTIPGIRHAQGLVGPPLAGIGERVYLAGRLTNTPEHLMRWIENPQSVDRLENRLVRLGGSQLQEVPRSLGLAHWIGSNDDAGSGRPR